MARYSALALTVIGAAAAASSGSAPAATCVNLSDLVSPVAFARYPAEHATSATWRGPDVTRGRAHLYRTMLRENVSGTPDFAGHYTVVHIGCGAGLACPAFVDRRTGRVFFPPAIRSVYFLPADTEPAGATDPLTYQADSRLLVILGARNEEDRTSGVTQYDWRDGNPRQLRFVPEASLCRNGKAYR